MTRPSRPHGELRRARKRRESGGAVLFIVAVTLGLLAAMGVYGLTATASDVRSAGYIRQSAQSQAAAEHALMLTAESFTPGTSGEIIRAMMSGQNGGADIQATTCKTANKFDITKPDERASQACLSWSTKEMENIAKSVNPWNIDPTTLTTFAPDSFGPVNTHAFIRVEITNPVDIPPPPGTGLNDRYTFTQLTVTTFVELKNAATPDAAKSVPAESVVQGRGRITVGPYFRQ